jgi:nucleotide-binding universal stress UspA family protein
VFRKILAAVDNSPRAPGVLAAARKVAACHSARLHLYRAVFVPPDIPPAGHTEGDPAAEALRKRAEQELASLVGGAPDVTVEPPEFGTGQPWRAILAAADRLDVDLIVIGSHGYGGLDRLLGTNAARVVNHSTRSVLVVHERAGGAPGQPPGGRP